MKKLKVILHSKYFYLFLIIITFIYSFIYLSIPKSSKLNINNDFIGIITNYKISGDLLTLELKSVEKIIGYYYFDTKEERNSFKDIYEGFNVTINPKPSENERDNDLDVAKYCKECLGKKIVGWKVTKYGEKVPDYVQDITSESPKELILELEDGIKMIFSHWLMAEYMDFTIKFPEKNKGK